MKTAEQKFIELFKEYTIEVLINDFPSNYVYRTLNGEWLIWHAQNMKSTFISFDLIWSIFENEYNMKYEEVQSFIKSMLFKYFNIIGTSPSITSFCFTKV